MSREVDKFWEEYSEIFSGFQWAGFDKQAVNRKFVALLREAGEKSSEPMTLKNYQRLRALGTRLIIDLRMYFKEEWGVVEFSDHTPKRYENIETVHDTFEVIPEE